MAVLFTAVIVMCSYNNSLKGTINIVLQIGRKYWPAAFDDKRTKIVTAQYNRLSIAAEHLLLTNNSISEISDMVGINDSVYFNKLFRKNFQMSPSKYREFYRSGKEH